MIAGQWVPFFNHVASVLDTWYDASMGHRVARVGSPVRLTGQDKSAVELVAYGQAKSYREAYQSLGAPYYTARRLGNRLTDLIESGHPEAQGEVALANARREHLIRDITLQKVEGAHEALMLLRELMRDEEVLPETRVKIAQDLLDRVPEASKVSRSQVEHTGPALALPAHKVDGLLSAIARASAAAARGEPERLGPGREIPEAEVVVSP